MKTKLLLAAVCIVALPMWFSNSKGDGVTNSAPFATVVLAGHLATGGWCECCSPGCICDPGENPNCSARPIPDASPVRGNPKAKASRASELDFGAGAFMIAFAIFMWSRMRA